MVEVQSNQGQWLCGQVIYHLLNAFWKEDKLLRSIATKLKVHNPKRRPSLLEWLSWTALPVSDGAKGWRAGESSYRGM